MTALTSDIESIPLPASRREPGYAEGLAAGRREVVVSLLRQAEVARHSWVLAGLAPIIASNLEGIAHNAVCGCEDSTVEHLHDWVRATLGEVA